MTRAPIALACVAAACALTSTVAKAEDPAQIERGRQVFQAWCFNCHGAGSGKPGTAALQAKYHGSKPALLEDRSDLPPDATKYFVRHGLSIMPFFRKTEIDDGDLEALALYLARNAK